MTTLKRSAAWAMINWANIQHSIEVLTTFAPDQASIEESIHNIEKEMTEEELFMKEAEELENLLITKLQKILEKKHGKEIKKRKIQQEKMIRQKKQAMANKKVGVQIMPFGGGNLKDLEKMGLDPKMMEQISRSMMDQLFGKRQKKKDDDEDDEDEDPGASFYM
ncbi:hypothetical protein [Candidatus Lokiarchaeum ossiferum]|uniref:hypothetical protein n=1 Tax=Candidatus Lokiarchaeum ossiferum TaxID=2951803 RepID=UPI00352C22E5